MTTRERRGFLQSAAAVTGGALVCSATRADHPPKATEGTVVPAGPTPTLNQRRNIAFLPTAELDQLREAFRILRANSNAIYDTWVNIHANNCQHNNNLLLPWHRAYLYYFEQRLQQAVPGGSPPITLPYWTYDRVGNGTGSDTVEFRRLPVPYRPQAVGGQPNSLWVQRRANVNAGTYVLPFTTVRTDQIVAGNPPFWSFTVNLENRPHNNVHNQLGLPMMNPLFSPRDPVFWLHHSTLDRAWEAWRAVPGHENLLLSPTLANWRRTPLAGFTGAQFPRRLVEDFLSTDDLGYTYVEQQIEVTLKASDKARLLSTADVDFATAKVPPMPADNLRPVRIRFDKVQQPRTVLQVRAFVGVPDANADTPLDDPGFAGMFTLYPPHADHGAVDPTMTLDLDATDTVRRLMASKKTTKFPVTVVTVRYTEDDKPQVAAAELKYKGVSVVIGD